MSDYPPPPPPPPGETPPPPPPESEPPPEPETEQLPTTEPVPEGTQAEPRPSEPERPRRWPWIAGIVVALFAGAAIGASGQEDEGNGDTSGELAAAQRQLDEAHDARDEAQVERDEALARVEELEGELAEATEATATTEAPTTTAPPTTAAPAGFGDGTYVVGEDIEPGRYSTPGGEFCYWERLSGFGGTLDEVIANDFSEGPVTVEIAGSDAGFSTSGCGTWMPAG